MNDLPVGRSVDEVLRLVQAFQFTDKYGEGRELPIFLCVCTYCIIYGNILSFCCMLSYNTHHISWNSTDMYCSFNVGFCEFACITKAKNSTLGGKEHNVLLQYWCCTECPNLTHSLLEILPKNAF